MAERSDYGKQLNESCRLVSESWATRTTVWCTKAAAVRPSQPWLEPDVCDAIEQLHQDQQPDHLVLVPIGFLSDHLEVMYDLDIEAADCCQRLGIRMVRAETVGTHPRFVRMIRELIQERIDPQTDRAAIGLYGPNHDVCPENCCLYYVELTVGSKAADGDRQAVATVETVAKVPRSVKVPSRIMVSGSRDMGDTPLGEARSVIPTGGTGVSAS
jgi:hypothetical protein